MLRVPGGACDHQQEVRYVWVSLSVALLTRSGQVIADTDPCAVEEPANQPPPTQQPPKPEPLRIQGVVRGKTSGELLIGVTVVAAQHGTKVADEAVAITDEHGAYSLAVPRGTYTLTFYYLDVTLEVPNVVISTDTTFVPTILEEPKGNDLGCTFWLDSSPDLGSMPRFGITTTRAVMPVSRDRTHRSWIAPAASADSNTAVTTISDGTRLQRAPGIPTAFVQEVSTSTLRVPIELAAGSGGAADVYLRGGSNETHGDARLVFGLDRARDATLATGGVEVFAGGPLRTDKVWMAAGLVANRQPDDQIDAHGMARLNYAKSSEHQGELVALAQALGDDTRDGWAQARWVSKFDDNKLELTAGATVEQLDLPASETARAIDLSGDVTNRAGGQVGAKWRHKMAGYHQLVAIARGGGGLRGTTRHDDVTLGVGDDWQLRPNIELQVGVRADARRFGEARTQVLSPRVSLAYDFTKEGRSDVFIAYQRVPHLDDGLPGDWLAAPSRHHDELATGVSYLPNAASGAVMFGVGGRARWSADDEAKLGLETWVRYQHESTVLHAGATTLGNVGTLVGQRRVVDRKANVLYAGTSLRVAPDRREGGGVLVWKHTGDRDRERSRSDLSFDFSLEGYGGSEGPGARLLLGASW